MWRHANATTLDIRVGVARGALVIEVVDDGDGFDLEAIGGRDRGRGLTSMQTMAGFLDAPLDITTSPGGGTHLRVQVAPRPDPAPPAPRPRLRLLPGG